MRNLSENKIVPKDQRIRERRKPALKNTEQERTERRLSFHEKVIPFTPLWDRLRSHDPNLSLSKGHPRSAKQRTPPSLEKDNIAKKIHFEEEKMTATGKKEQTETRKDLTELEQHKARILAKIDRMQSQIQDSINELKEEWKEHKEELKQVKVENYRLEHSLNKEKQKTRNLGCRVRWLKDKLLENNIIMHGITESPWES